MDFGNARKRIVRRLKFVKDERQRTKLILELKAIEQGRAKYPNGEEMDADYRRMKYARYADDFLVGIIGSKQDAQQIKKILKTSLLTDWHWSCPMKRHLSLTRKDRPSFSDMKSL